MTWNLGTRINLVILSKTTHCWSITNCCTKWVLNDKAILNWHLKIICKAGIFCYLITIFYKVSVWFWAYALAYREINVRSADIILPSLGKSLHISWFKWKWQNLIMRIHTSYISTNSLSWPNNNRIITAENSLISKKLM